MDRRNLGFILAGAAAGAVTGLFGAGGGMVLVPLLHWLTDLTQRELFSVSIAVILPICLVSIALTPGPLPLAAALPYLIGSGLGGVLAGLLGKYIPAVWLHRGLGLLILWGGWQYLWS